MVIVAGTCFGAIAVGGVTADTVTVTGADAEVITDSNCMMPKFIAYKLVHGMLTTSEASYFARCF